jgi:hypothetical protein
LDENVREKFEIYAFLPLIFCNRSALERLRKLANRDAASLGAGVAGWRRV